MRLACALRLVVLLLSLGGCSDLKEAVTPVPVAPDGPGGSCDHAWSSRTLTRLGCEFGSNDKEDASLR